MHELPFVKTIFKSTIQAAEEAGAERVLKVRIEAGAMRDFIPELVQKYWKYAAKDSIAEEAELEMTRIEATARCSNCGHIFPIDTSRPYETHCPRCGCDRGTLESGNELKIVEIEII